MKQDFLFIREFNLYHIIVDENIGNTLCGYIPQKHSLRYANLVCSDFNQLYNLLQASRAPNDAILPELAEKLFTETERPVIIDAESLTADPFIRLNLGLCLRQGSEAEMEGLGEMSYFEINRFYVLPDMRFRTTLVDTQADEDLIEIARRFHDYQIILACGCPQDEAKKYFDLEDEVLFSLGRNSFEKFYQNGEDLN